MEDCMAGLNSPDPLHKAEWLILRIALLLLTLIGIVKVLKVELSSLW